MLKEAKDGRLGMKSETAAGGAAAGLRGWWYASGGEPRRGMVQQRLSQLGLHRPRHACGPWKTRVRRVSVEISNGMDTGKNGRTNCTPGWQG